MNQRAITLILLLIVAVPAALLFGQWSATDPVVAASVAVGIIVIMIIFVMRTRIWLLIPLTLAFTGSVNLLPGHFALKDVVMGLASTMMVVHWLITRYPTRFRFSLLEGAILIQLVLLAVAFARNPVGFMILGGSTVGGKPYFEIGVACITCLVLGCQIVNWRDVKIMVVYMLAGSILVGIFETIVGFFPAIAAASMHVYHGQTAGVAAGKHASLETGGYESGRMIFLALFPRPIYTFLLGFNKPLQLLRPHHFVTFMSVIFAGICLLMAGFRSGILGLAMYVIAAAYLHRCVMQIFGLALFGIPLFAGVIMMQGTVIDLPPQVQRVFSFLPGDWDYDVVIEAQGSSEWRFEMWEEALRSDRYIRNKWLGDGFGYSSEELDYQVQISTRTVTPEEMQEYFLMVGSFHSGPVETIKRTGYLGLASLLFAMVVMLVYAKNMVERSRGTRYYPYSIILALPFMVLPFFFVLVFGAYQGAMMQMLVGIGMIRLFHNSLDQWEAEQRDAQREVAT